MGPALSPPYGFLHASTDEAVCEPEGRPPHNPPEGRRHAPAVERAAACLRWLRGTSALRSTACPSGQIHQVLGEALRKVEEAAAGESEDPPLSFTPSWIVLENRRRGGCLRGGEGGLGG